ncbi:ISAs1 family transposase, partial [Myxococcota bacterium]
TRIADNTFGNLIPRLELAELVKRLVAMVKAEHRRGNLATTQLPMATAAIDGKNVATLRWHDLCRVLELDSTTAKPKQVKKLLKKEFPNVQLCIPKDGEPYALARVHTVTLISSQAANCIYQRPIEGRTNEIGAMPALLKDLRAAYGRTDIVAMLTTDAGNTSLGTATMIVDKLHWDYLSQFKSEHGQLHSEANRLLSRRRESTADESYVDTQNGYVVTYHVWHEDLSEHGWLDWSHARQLVRVQRVAEHPTTGHRTVGNRYYVTSKTSSQLAPKDALTISRGHWRCEEETHWTTDVVLQEDRRRLAWSRHPHGVFVISVLRMMALNILAVARKLSKLSYSNQTPTWQQVAEHFLLVLCATTLLTEEFDEVSE